MTIDEVLDALDRTRAKHDCNPVASAADIAETERAIGHTLPGSFRRFVSEIGNGAYLFGVQEVSGVGDVEIPRPIHRNEWHYGPEGVGNDGRVSIREGGEAQSGSLVPFSLDSNGNEWCFIDDGSLEPAVAYFAGPLVPRSRRRLYAPLAGGFREWLAILVEHPEDEVVRTVYRDDEDVLYDELMLG